MTARFLILLASALWLLMCLRFWTMIDRRNTWQRHFIAIAGGVGAGMIYILGSMVWTLLRIPEEPPMSAPVHLEAAGDVRVVPRTLPKS
jgi:hypothetical protein